MPATVHGSISEQVEKLAKLIEKYPSLARWSVPIKVFSVGMIFPIEIGSSKPFTPPAPQEPEEEFVFGALTDEQTGFIPLAKTSDDIDMTVGPHTAGDGRAEAVIRDKSRTDRCWTGEGNNESEAASEAIKKFLSDRRAPEYVGGKKG